MSAIRKLVMLTGGAVMVSVFVCGFIAYFVTSFDVNAQQWYDGFGRPLSASPWFMRLIFGQERLWAGWFWFLADMLIFWGGLAIGFTFVNLGQSDKHS